MRMSLSCEVKYLIQMLVIIKLRRQEIKSSWGSPPALAVTSKVPIMLRSKKHILAVDLCLWVNTFILGLALGFCALLPTHKKLNQQKLTSGIQISNLNQAHKVTFAEDISNNYI